MRKIFGEERSRVETHQIDFWLATDHQEQINANQKLEEALINIPKINLREKITEGDNEELALDLGVWRRPNGGRPGEGRNIILTAHRFHSKPGKNYFYHLGKLKKGDEVVIFWEGKKVSLHSL